MYLLCKHYQVLTKWCQELCLPLVSNYERNQHEFLILRMPVTVLGKTEYLGAMHGHVRCICGLYRGHGRQHLLPTEANNQVS